MVPAYLWSVRELVFAVVNLVEIARARIELANAPVGDGLDALTAPEYLIERALALNGVLGSKQVEAINSENLEVLARMVMERGDPAAAAEYLNRALAINEEIESDVGRASNLNNLGLVSGIRGDPQAAEGYLQRSLAITEGGDGGECFRVEYWKVEDGVDSAAKSVRIIDVPVKYRDEYKQDPDEGLHKLLKLKELAADGHGNLGVLARERGDLATAALAFERVFEVHKEVHNRQGMATDLDNLAMIAHMRADLGGACTAWTRAMMLYREIGWTRAAEGVSGRMRAAGCPNEGM